MLLNIFRNKLRFFTDDSKYSLFTTKDILRLVIPLFFEQMLFRLVGSSYLIARWIDSGVLAVWIAMILDWLVRIAGFYWRYRSNTWTKLVHLKS